MLTRLTLLRTLVASMSDVAAIRDAILSDFDQLFDDHSTPNTTHTMRGMIHEMANRFQALLDERTSDGLMAEFVAERGRAHRKHLATSMERCAVFADRRCTILTEELGEVARCLNDCVHSNAVDAEHVTRMNLRGELVQMGAMVVAWIAALDGEELPPEPVSP